jgi:cytidylate kinase
MAGASDRAALGGAGKTNANFARESDTSSSQFAESARTILVVMRVSGSGKTTIAKAVADRLGWPFEEGDELHPASDMLARPKRFELLTPDSWSGALSS